MNKIEDQIEELSRNLGRMLEVNARALNGSDKSWKRECKQEVESLRRKISKLCLVRDRGVKSQ